MSYSKSSKSSNYSSKSSKCSSCSVDTLIRAQALADLIFNTFAAGDNGGVIDDTLTSAEILTGVDSPTFQPFQLAFENIVGCLICPIDGINSFVGDATQDPLFEITKNEFYLSMVNLLCEAESVGGVPCDGDEGFSFSM